uniref:J domain-containing protein n=1 Tax=Angiostrongylus cantonensis TaxID=6313 RepID=A0A0K0D129_ANGCA
LPVKALCLRKSSTFNFLLCLRTQEIKAAYFKLSKQYHPDRNRDNKDEAAAKFHQVALAYEVLGSDEKRKIYDMMRIRTPSDLRSSSYSFIQFTYTDLDIDYKNFEHFQRLTRRRKQYHSHFDMPEEFYAEFGGKRPVYKSEYDPPKGSIHRDSRVVQREEEEFLREIQREQVCSQSKYPIPTFEQMLREKRRKQQEETRRQTIGSLILVTTGLAIYWISKFFR